jgi:histidinol-phosphate phosphatase family protein
MASLKTAVFLDRDGTINEDKGYIRHPSEVCLIPGAAMAIKALNDRGIKVIVVSNQSGVARGFLSLHDLEKVNKRLVELLDDVGGAHLDALYVCPHLPDDACKCRKPAVGLVKKAIEEHGVKCSYVVGDKGADIGLARRSGAGAVLVRTGHGEEELAHLAEDPDFIARDLTEAVAWILNDLEDSMPGGDV